MNYLDVSGIFGIGETVLPESPGHFRTRHRLRSSRKSQRSHCSETVWNKLHRAITSLTVAALIAEPGGCILAEQGSDQTKRGECAGNTPHTATGCIAGPIHHFSAGKRSLFSPPHELSEIFVHSGRRPGLRPRIYCWLSDFLRFFSAR